MHLRSRRIKMAEKNGLLIHFWNPLQFYILQQDEDAPHILQRISRLEAVISKLLNSEIESLEATNIECSLPNVSIRMRTLKPLQLTEKEQNCVKFAHPQLELQIKKHKA